MLKRLNFVEDIPAWNPAFRSPIRLRGSHKHHLCDPSIAASLIGADPASLASDPKTLGLLFESLALHDLMVCASANDAFVSHYHDAEGLEADAIVWKRNGDWIPVEVKLGSAQVPSAAENLSRLEKKMVGHGERPPAAKVVLVGFGEMAHRLPDGTQVVPIDTLGA